MTIQERRNGMKTVNLKIEIEGSGDAFQQNAQEEVAEIVVNLGLSLKEAAAVEGGPVRDSNGNTVGAWSLRVTDADPI
jgi:hypothetical protein